MLKEFKEFIMRGNVMDMAVGVVVGGAFTAIVTAIVGNLITPLIGLVISAFGVKNVDKLEAQINGVTFGYGAVISAIITFLITALVVFLIVKAMNKAQSLGKKSVEEVVEDVIEELDAQEALLTEIRDLLAKK